MSAHPDDTPPPDPFADFREQGHRFVDWIADYLETVERRPVCSPSQPGEVFDALPSRAPERPEGWDAILADVERVILPGLTHWQHPSFFAYFPASASAPAILGDLLSSGLGVQGMLWSTSPACTEVETRVLDWLARAMGLDERFVSDSGVGAGVIQSTASEAALVAMVAARERAERAGASAESLAAYTSDQAHSSIVKAAMISGVGRDRVRQVPVDGAMAMRADALREAMERDRRDGLRPFFVCATVGTTSSTAVDPVREIGAISRDAGAWLHVDAAFAGVAAICPEHRWLLDGCEAADSVNTNPHKWMLTNFDCSALWVADRRALVDALSITPEYLRNAASESGTVIDYRDWQIPLGRRFRALKLWFVMRRFGLEGLRAHIREHIRLAAWFEAQVRADARFELAAPRTLSLVCFRLKAATGEEADRRSRALLDAVNASGRAFLTHTVLPALDAQGRMTSEGRVALRMAIGGAQTRREHVQNAWDLIAGAASTL